MTDPELLAHISRLPHARGNFKHLVRELGARGTKRVDLETALARLTTRGDLVELRSGQFVVTARSREYTIGRLNMHRDGYGFVIPERPVAGLAGDVFIPPDSAEKAMHGDRVLARIARIETSGRADGEIVKMLKRANPTVVGEFRIGRRGRYVVPHDERIQQWIDIPEGLEFPPPEQSLDRIGVKPVQVSSVGELDGMVVNVELLEFPEKGEGPVGRVIEILGNPDDFGVDVEIVIRKHHLPNRFPPEVVEQAQAVPLVITAKEIEGRRDFRAMDIVTIDGETARDFDDAVWVDRSPNGNYLLHVHIADVSHYVTPGTPIDVEARLRGTSVYFPDRAIPMLPFELSTNICSLNPSVDRLVLSALLEIDHQGEIAGQEFTAGVIRSKERMTYTNVHLLLEGDEALRERYRPLVARFELMRELAEVLNRKRVRRGSIDFDLPEPLIEFDEFGAMTGVTRAPRNIAHRIIEEFMLAANEAVASHLENTLDGVHLPDPREARPEARDGFRGGGDAFRRVIGERCDRAEVRVHGPAARRFEEAPRDHAGGLFRRLKFAELPAAGGEDRRETGGADPELPDAALAEAGALQRGKHGAFRAGAPALYPFHIADPPLPRPDGAPAPPRGLLGKTDQAAGETELSEIAEESSQSERRAADAERELVEWKKVRFMEERVGEEFAGLMISVTKYGLFVELTDLFVEGLVPIDTLPGDQYAYQENVHKIVGKRTRREFAIGDQVRVFLDRVDANERKLQFALVEEPSKRPGRSRKRPAL